jgi:hypothetical protein
MQGSYEVEQRTRVNVIDSALQLVEMADGVEIRRLFGCRGIQRDLEDVRMKEVDLAPVFIFEDVVANVDKVTSEIASEHVRGRVAVEHELAHVRPHWAARQLRHDGKGERPHALMQPMSRKKVEPLLLSVRIWE